MELSENKLKAALEEGHVQHGIWLSSGSALLAELAGQAGFDWCLIDSEHGPNSLSEILPQAQALQATGTSCVVRVTAPERWMIKQVLDLGVQSILVPMVHSAELARDMAAAMRYPPQGTRGVGASFGRASGFGAMGDYVLKANHQVCCFVQAESAAAVADIDAIASTEGVDGVFVGPADLSADMGFPGQPGHPDVVAAIDHVIARTIAAGKVAGIITLDPERAVEYAAKGVTFLAVGGDTATLRVALKDLAQKVKR